jgi:2-polyprenyl-6-methoxyphenol hydroxylase-like FAD-dependent oxidoreductase
MELPTDRAIQTDVLIVGAGPTGLVLSTMLQRAGIAHLIVDKLAEGQNLSRAAVLHAHTLDVLECIGAPARLAPRGLRLRDFSIRDRDRLLLRLAFHDLPTRHSYLLMIPQDRTEHVLEELLGEAGGRVRRGAEVQSLTRTARGARAIVNNGDGTITEVEARYVVGADGMRSVVRQAAGIGFTGATYEDTFVLADVDMTWLPGRSEVMLFFHPRACWSWCRCRAPAVSVSSRHSRIRRSSRARPTSRRSSMRAVRRWTAAS